MSGGEQRPHLTAQSENKFDLKEHLNGIYLNEASGLKTNERVLEQKTACSAVDGFAQPTPELASKWRSARKPVR